MCCIKFIALFIRYGVNVERLGITPSEISNKSYNFGDGLVYGNYNRSKYKF